MNQSFGIVVTESKNNEVRRVTLDPRAHQSHVRIEQIFLVIFAIKTVKHSILTLFL